MSKIVVYDPLGFSDDQIQIIRDATGGEYEVVVAPLEKVGEEIVDAEIFMGYHKPDVFQKAPNLKWIQSSSAGMDAMLDEPLVARGLPISNASGVHGPQVCELAWSLTLAVARGHYEFGQYQREHTWEPKAWSTHRDMEGSTAGIVGLGGIGLRYAKVASAFGMTVKGVDLYPREMPDFVDSVAGMDQLDELLGEADVVMISCPYTDDTHHLINADRLAKMKSTAILVNIARGEIVDEDALIHCLNNDGIFGAGLDVTSTEPLPSDSPLWDTPRLIITPHIAGLTGQRMQRLAEFFAANLVRFRAGEPLKNLIDPAKGYPVPK